MEKKIMKKLLIATCIFTAFNCLGSTPQNSSRTSISDIFKSISSFFASKEVVHDNSCSESQNLWLLEPYAFSVNSRELTLAQKASDRNDSILHDRTCKLICQKYQLNDKTTPIEIDHKEYWYMKELALRELYHEGYFDRTYAEGWQRIINEELEQLKRDFPDGKRESFSYNPHAPLFEKRYFDETDFLLRKIYEPKSFLPDEENLEENPFWSGKMVFEEQKKNKNSSED